MVYGASAFAWADHFTGSRTWPNPAFLIAGRYAGLMVTPQAPTLGASRALPKLTPGPRALTASAAGSAARAAARSRMGVVMGAIVHWTAAVEYGPLRLAATRSG